VTALIGLAEAQTAQGMDVRIIATWRSESEIPVAERLRGNGVKVDLIGPCTGPLVRHPKLNSTIGDRVTESDVVHIHALWEEIQHLSAVHSRQARKPYIIRPCGMLDPWSLAQSKWKKRVYMAWRLRRNLASASALHFSTLTESQCAGKLGLKPPAIVEPNGVDLKEFVNLPAKGTFRAKYPQLAGRPYVVFLGRLHPGKGAEMLIPAFAKLRNKEAMLVLVGPDQDGYKAHLESMVRDNKLENRVIFTGMQKGLDRVAALADADLFSLPSEHENFGIAVVEALAAGLPVVISDQVYLHPDVTAANVGGVVPMNIDALARELDRWLDYESLRTSATSRARPFVWDRYDWLQIARRWKGHYDQLMTR
jgi:glycosyltransferase involved in cell wall biosynthesis